MRNKDFKIQFKDIPQMTIARYSVDVFWDMVPEWVKEHKIDMNPDFQRGYVWSDQQKVQYVEWIMRGGRTGKDIYFNHPGWMGSFEGQMVVVDGKQRLNAVLEFMDNRFKAYGFFFKEFDRLDILICAFKFHVADLKTRKEVLQWYLDMNTGGTIHTDDEIEKVKELIRLESVRKD